MAKYIMLSSLTDEGAQTIKKNPERIKEVNKDVEALGGKVLDQYAVLGEYDFMSVLEAPTWRPSRASRWSWARGAPCT
ncbi:MAG: GYD domain-containing protein [Actinomycetota bacterium]